MKFNHTKALLPLIEFPTKVVLVDDNIDFLKSLEMLFAPKGIEFIGFNDPFKALEFLRNQKYRTFVDQYLKQKEDASIFAKTIDINLHALSQEINNDKRFNEVSALVIDFAMPGMNGQEFCKQITDLPIQTLLLTGEASYEKAVEMFNSKIITNFVQKSNDISILYETIKNLQHKYFQDITQELLFALKNPSGMSIFADTAFINFFDLICQKHNIIEYYVVDENGSYLLADKSGTLKLLIVKSEEDMQVLHEIAEGDHSITEEISNALHERKIIAFLQSEEDLTKPVKDWNFYKATPIDEKETHHYALVDAIPALRMSPNKITSYQDYLRSS